MQRILARQQQPQWVPVWEKEAVRRLRRNSSLHCHRGQHLREGRHLLLPLDILQDVLPVQETMHLDGNLTTPARLNAIAAMMLVRLTDQLTGRRYLVDTGASFSLVPLQSRAPTEDAIGSVEDMVPVQVSTYSRGGVNASFFKMETAEG